MTTELEHLRALQAGEHLCLLHDSEQERLAAIVPFVRRGLAEEQRFLYLSHDRTEADVLDCLRREGIEVDEAQQRGALVVVGARDFYLRDGRFDPERTIAVLRGEAAKAKADGFQGLRFTGEMGWALGPEPGCGRLVEYEALVSEVLEECGVTAICQYDRRLFPARLQRDVSRTHPVVVLGEQVCANAFYEPPRFVLTGADEEDRVEWMLGQLRRARAAQQQCETALAERDQSVAELRSQRSRLSQLLHQMPAGVVIADGPAGEIAFANDRADEMFSLLRHDGPPGVDDYGSLALRRPGGEPLADRDAPLARSLRGEVLTSETFEFARPGGEARTFTCNAAPLLDDEGEVVGAMAAFVDVTESRRAAGERERLLEEATANDRRKDEFLAMLGHELRNPLGAISNGLQVLRRRTASDDRARHERDVLDRQVKNMARLLDDLLDVSRITRGLTQLTSERIDLAGVIARAVATTAPLMQLRRHQLGLSLPPEPVPVEGDGTRLEQILVNLLSNAAKYTEPGGQVTLSLRREEGQAVVRVRDTGDGIPKELLPRIFEMFTQGERRLDRSQGGLGVGLTLARRLAELHGGSIDAHSDGPGLGSEFVVRLPALVPELSSAPLPRLESAEAPSLEGSTTVLLVEDNVDAAAMLFELLQMVGYKVHVAHDGPSGLELAARVQPDVVVLDIGLPGMDGYEVAQRLRRDPRTASGLIIALTGYGQESDRRRSRQAGFDHHLVKPVDIDELDRVIGLAKERRAERQAAVG